MATDRIDPEWLWWCSGCERNTEMAPCEHCGAGHDEVLVLEPGQRPPLRVIERDGWPTVEDYEWPEEAYLDA